ncbi:hypothetical protein BGZ57DRAFT_993978 [Hyaloscypha finlandica]|nr:hypothetical protein BGZ57DRAFT_993978 [Hyaloscypha finlandica]
MAPNQQLVTVSLGESKDGSVSLSALEEAFGQAALRILIMKELPANFQPLHINWLSAASYLARLSSEQLGRDENQLPKFEFASSDADLSRPLDQSSSSLQCGLESRKGSLKSGQYYTMKGSFYATIMHPYLQSWSNIWPPECLLPGFREEFEELCTMTIDITLLVAKACDQFAVEFVNMTIRARLLHYFLPSEPSLRLTSALFLDDSPPLPPLSSTFKPAPSFHQSSDPLAGIYIRSRTPEVVKVNIPAGCVAFQTGSALGKMTGGVLKDVPHFVRGPNAGRSTVVKNTLAVFTQPNLG